LNRKIPLRPADTIICAEDKDLNCIPGAHYNWVKDELYHVEPIDGMRWFYTQLITGDTADDIRGLSKKAPKRRTFKTKPLDSMTTEKEMFDYVFDGYAYEYCDEAVERMLEMGRLLWIRQEPNQLWSFPE